MGFQFFQRALKLALQLIGFSHSLRLLSCLSCLLLSLYLSKRLSELLF